MYAPPASAEGPPRQDFRSFQSTSAPAPNGGALRKSLLKHSLQAQVRVANNGAPFLRVGLDDRSEFFRRAEHWLQQLRREIALHFGIAIVDRGRTARQSGGADRRSESLLQVAETGQASAKARGRVDRQGADLALLACCNWIVDVLEGVFSELQSWLRRSTSRSWRLAAKPISRSFGRLCRRVPMAKS